METVIPEISKSKIKKSFSEFRDSLLDPEFIVSLRDLDHRNYEGRDFSFVNNIIDDLIYSELKFSGDSSKNGQTKLSFDTIKNDNGQITKVMRIHRISICTRDLLSKEELNELFIKGLAEVLEISILGTTRKKDVWSQLLERIKLKTNS